MIIISEILDKLIDNLVKRREELVTKLDSEIKELIDIKVLMQKQKADKVIKENAKKDSAHFKKKI